MKENIICYFSASNNTKEVANLLHDYLDSDIYEIKPEVKYTPDDLDWTNKQSRSTLEMEDETCRPKIEGNIDVSNYNNVIIGFPVWWYTFPRIINTFVENTNLEGKNIILFCTSGGSSIEKSLKDFKEKYPTLNVKSGKRLTGRETKEEIITWINE